MNASQEPTGSWFRPNSRLGWAAVALTVLSFALFVWGVSVAFGEPASSHARADAMGALAAVAGALASVSAVIAIVRGDRNLTTLLLTVVWGFVFLAFAVGS
jgi:hypothetical protein